MENTSNIPREAHFRKKDPRLRAREAAWSKEARKWVRTTLLKEVLPTATEDQTVADLLIALDTRDDLPPGYVHLIHNALYKHRYQMVRSVVLQLAESGELQVGSTVNAKGRDAVACYRIAPPKPTPRKRSTWEACLVGPAVTPEIERGLIQWVEANEPALSGLNEILLVRRKSADMGVNNTHGQKTSREAAKSETGAEAPKQRRRRATRTTVPASG